MSNAHVTKVSSESRDWKYGKDDDDYCKKEGCKAVITSSFVVCDSSASRALKNYNPFVDNEPSYKAVDERPCYTNNHVGVENERNYVVASDREKSDNHRIDWRDGELLHSTLFNDSDETEHASYNFEHNFDADDQYSRNPFDEEADYYEGAVGGSGDSSGELYWNDENDTEQLDETGGAMIGAHDGDVFPPNNRFVTEIDESFDSHGSFNFEDIFNESDIELDDEGSVAFKAEPLSVEYHSGMTIEEMGELMERAKQCNKSTGRC